MNEQAQKLIESWDNGDLINTIEMGGLGPSYEQAIQVAAIEFTRAGLSFETTGEANKRADFERWKVLCDETIQKIDTDLGGLTGAQFGAAAQLAWLWVTKGPEYVLESVKEERRICAQNFWPQVKR